MSQQEQKADSIIKKAIIAAAAVGVQPAFVDTPFLVATNGAMLVALAKAYSYDWSEERSARFIKHVVAAGGVSVASWKALALVVQAAMAASIIGLPIALTANGAVNALITYSLGQAAKHYFESGGEASDDAVTAVFLDNLTLGGFRRVRGMLKE